MDARLSISNTELDRLRHHCATSYRFLLLLQTSSRQCRWSIRTPVIPTSPMHKYVRMQPRYCTPLIMLHGIQLPRISLQRPNITAAGCVYSYRVLSFLTVPAEHQISSYTVARRVQILRALVQVTIILSPYEPSQEYRRTEPPSHTSLKLQPSVEKEAI